jgi:hypothetical protein
MNLVIWPCHMRLQGTVVPGAVPCPAARQMYVCTYVSDAWGLMVASKEAPAVPDRCKTWLACTIGVEEWLCLFLVSGFLFMQHACMGVLQSYESRDSHAVVSTSTLASCRC